MGTNDVRSTHLSRRKFIATGIATGATLLTSQSLAMQVSSPETNALTPDALLDAILQNDAPDEAIDAVIELFARSGIAVFDDAITQPYIPPATPVSPLSFQRWQLTPLVDEMVNGNARPAAEYDALIPSDTSTGEAVPTFGELLAGYYGGAETPGADFTRAYFHRMIGENLNITAVELPAPTLIVSLFAGEIMGQFQETAGLGSAQKRAGAPWARSDAAILAYTQVPGLSLPGLPEIPAIPNIDLPAMPSSSGVCGAAQGFISVVMQRVFSVLKAAETVTDIPILGGILGAILDGVKIGLGVITKAVDTLLAPVLGIIRSIGAALSVASLLVGTLSPWTVTIAFDPTRTRFGVDAEVVTGKFDVIAGGWDRVEIPPVLSECASLIGLDLPKPTSADAPVHVAVHQPLPLIAVDNPELRLDDTGRATANYVTQNESAERAKGREVIGIAWVQATVERDDLKKLKDDLFKVLFAQLPDLVAQVIRPIIGPVADELTNKLIALVTITAQQPLFVTYHQPKEPDDDPAPDTDEDDCIPGKFHVNDPAVGLRMVAPELASIEVVSGALIMDFQPGGAFVTDYTGLVLSMEAAPGVAFTFSFSGGETGTWSSDGSTLMVNITSTTVGLDGDFAGVPIGVTGGGAGSVGGPYICGDPVVWQLAMEGVGTVSYELFRID